MSKKPIVMKQTVLFFSLLSLLAACHKDNKIPTTENEIVSCTPSGPYDFLNNYTLCKLYIQSLPIE